MGMIADHQVGAVVEGGPADLSRIVVGQSRGAEREGLVLAPPVVLDGDDVRLGARLGDLPAHLGGVEARADQVEADHRHLQATHVPNADPAEAAHRHALAQQQLLGLGEALGAVVGDVVVGHVGDADVGPGHAVGDAGVTAELEAGGDVGAVGDQRRLEVDDGEVAAAEQSAGGGERVAPVPDAAQRVLGEPRRDQVAGDHQHPQPRPVQAGQVGRVAGVHRRRLQPGEAAVGTGDQRRRQTAGDRSAAGG